MMSRLSDFLVISPSYNRNDTEKTGIYKQAQLATPAEQLPFAHEDHISEQVQL